MIPDLARFFFFTDFLRTKFPNLFNHVVNFFVKKYWTEVQESRKSSSMKYIDYAAPFCP
jgi:hypothetical protein